MGVDAEMFVRIKGKENWLSEDDVKRLAYEIGTAFDNQFFFTMNPRQGVFNKKRRALEIMRPLKDVSDAENYGLEADMVGHVVWSQDGEPIVAGDDEQFIKANLYHRYYGEGYERGDWPKLRACIFWLTVRIPAGEVWYGGDSSGICAKYADKSFLDAMDLHWAVHARRPYVRYESSFKPFLHGQVPVPICELCEVPMADCGGGGKFTFYWCDGCGQKASAHVNGTVAWAKLHDDYPTFDGNGNPVERRESAA